MQLNNKPILKNYRKGLRNNMTEAEIVLWKYLKGSQLDGKKFRRQHSFGNYILDFYCASLKLAVELDGAHHFTEEGMAYDETRTQFLNEHGIVVIRFENEAVLKNVQSVLDEISKCWAPPPGPS